MREQKVHLRTQLKAFRQQLSAEELRRRSTRISDHIRDLPEILSAKCVHVFWPMADRMEVDTRPLIAWLYTHKKQIVLPVVVNEREGVHRLEHRQFSGEDALVRNGWGILEPVKSDIVPAESIDAVVIPALGVDRQGNRIGYGRGFYDRFLRDLQVPTICPVFGECFIDRIPNETHDVPVQIIVTEREVVRTHAVT